MQVFRLASGVLALAGAAVLILFTYLNGDAITLDLYFRTVELPLAWALGGAFVAGIALSTIVYLPLALRRRGAMARLRRELDQNSRELENLRNGPIRDAT